MTHDQLQFKCFQWFWNSYPGLRMTFWGIFNDIKQVEKITGPISAKKRIIILSKMKSLGMVKGVLDLMFYHRNTLYVMDCKVGKDKLSKEQKEFIKAIEAQGGKGFKFSTLEEFQGIILNILQNDVV